MLNKCPALSKHLIFAEFLEVVFLFRPSLLGLLPSPPLECISGVCNPRAGSKAVLCSMWGVFQLIKIKVENQFLGHISH